MGQSFSLIGTWMQHVALSWLVYRLTGSALLLGLIGFISQIPSLVLSPLAGVLADQWDRRRLMIATQVLAMVQAVILTSLVIAGAIRIWEIIVLSAVMGIVNSFDVPIRQAFVVEMVEDRDDLANAIALNSSMFHGTRLIGPAVAGILIGMVGEGICFLLNALSYLAVIFSLTFMRTTPAPVRTRGRHILPELREGLSYAYGSLPIRSILLLLAFVRVLGLPYVVLLPVFAREILHGGAHTYGFLVTASGAGSLAAALYLAARKNVAGLEKIIAFSPAVMVRASSPSRSPGRWCCLSSRSCLPGSA
jgi:MFS family permease